MSTYRPDETWTLDELTSDAEVTVRTVRYYIAEGLLPPPEGAGRAARYTQEHRDRLSVISALKERHLPLREIRDLLQGLSPEEIADLAQQSRQGRGAAPRDQQPPDTDAALDRRPGQRASHQRGAAGTAPPGDSSALEYIRSIQESTPAYRYELPRSDPSDQQWRRLPITPEAELLITEEVWHRRHEQIESLLAWARRVISEP
ncbi:MAG TPA: MerR family transcriptional regulator [Thermomicrobiales bacterium]|nr:MerR family transcriptional regulator [Thermomicrobiales bacterium]